MPGGGYVTTYTDITESKLAENELVEAKALLEQRVADRTGELEQAMTALQQAKAEAEEANASKTRFLAAAAHDLLQPLNAAKLFAALLNEHRDSMPDEQGGLFASADFIRNFGPFRDKDDLADVPFIGLGGNTDQMVGELNRQGVPVTEASIVAGSENHLVHWQLARSGIGIGLNGWDAGKLTPGMHRILEDELNFAFPVWLVAPAELRTSARVRVVFDALVDHIGSFRRVRSD